MLQKLRNVASNTRNKWRASADAARSYTRSTLDSLVRWFAPGRFPPSHLDRFTEWRNSSVGDVETFDFLEWSKAKGRDRQPEEVRREEFTGAMDRIFADASRVVNWSLQDRDPRPRIPCLAATIRVLTFNRYGQPAPLVLENARVQHLHLADHPKRLELRRCWIGALYVGPGKHSIDLRGCTIGLLHFAANSIGELRLDGCHLLSVDADTDNPFAGPVVLQNLWMPRYGEFLNLHSLRSVRGHLSERHNQLAAGVFHSVELALDRKNERFWSRAFSWIYEIGCDFGNSISRPVIWLLAAWAAIGAVVLAVDAVTVGDTSRSLAGWQAALNDDRWLRAAVYPFQATLNPLGIFSGRSLLIARSWGWSLVLQLVGLIGTTAVAFTVIAVRRRFKLE